MPSRRVHPIRRPRRLPAARARLALTAALALGSLATGAQGPAQPRPQTPPAATGAGVPQSPASAEAEPQAPRPVFRTDINFVRVDVIVTDKQGRPVTDLTQADFEVTEDGKPQAVETFKLVEVTGQVVEGAERARDIRSTYDEESEAQREDTRIFVFFLDDYHVRRGSSMGVREPLARFIRDQLGPLDMIGVMYPLMPVSMLTLTRDHESVIREIERFEGRKFDYRPRNTFEEQYSMYPAEIVERVRTQVSLSALEGLAVRLGGLREGRKAVVLVSEGYSFYLPPQLRDPVAEMPGLGNPARGRPTLGEGTVAEERKQFFDSADMQHELQQVYSAANRANTAIYTLDPRGLAVFEFDLGENVGPGFDRQALQDTQDTLRTIADETDGRAIVNRNDLEGGLRQVVRDTSAYYLIGYNSTQAPSDGKFHQIRVRIRRPGVQVRARKGYWALTAEEVTRALAPPPPGPERGVTEALASVETPSRARVVRTWVGTRPGDDGRTRVTFVWEPVPPVPGETRRDTASRVSLIAAGGDGAAYFRGKVPGADGSGATAAGARTLSPTASGRGAAVEFDAPPGRLQLRVAIEGESGRTVDSDVLDLDVPDYTAPQVRLTSPEVLRARTAIEYRQLAADPDAMPVADREFRRTERLLVRFTALGPGETAPETAARLLNRAGKPMSDLPSTALAGEPRRFQVDVPLAGLPAGEYVLELKGSAGGSEARQFVGFRVVS